MLFRLFLAEGVLFSGEGKGGTVVDIGGRTCSRTALASSA
jgi:hypothetical protein